MVTNGLLTETIHGVPYAFDAIGRAAEGLGGAVQRLLSTIEESARRDPESPGQLVLSRLAPVSAALSVISFDLPVVGPLFALIGDRVPRVGAPISLVSFGLPAVGALLPLIDDYVLHVAEPVPPTGDRVRVGGLRVFAHEPHPLTKMKQPSSLI